MLKASWLSSAKIYFGKNINSTYFCLYSHVHNEHAKEEKEENRLATSMGYYLRKGVSI